MAREVSVGGKHSLVCVFVANNTQETSRNFKLDTIGIEDRSPQESLICLLAVGEPGCPGAMKLWSGSDPMAMGRVLFPVRKGRQ
jgi:hypothetical protein